MVSSESFFEDFFCLFSRPLFMVNYFLKVNGVEGRVWKGEDHVLASF